MAPHAHEESLPTLWTRAGLAWKELAKRIWKRFREDRITDQSAKLSFYFLLSIFPFLFFLTSILGLVLRSGERLQQMLEQQLSRLIPPAAYDLLQGTLAEITQGAGGFSLSVAALATIWTASRGMAAVIEGLNVAYDIRQPRSWWKRNLLAVGLTLAVTVCITLALALLMYGARATAMLADYLGYGGFIRGSWTFAKNLLMLGLLLAAFNALYILAPNVKNRRWHWLMPGTVVGVGLWLAASYGFKLYLNYFDRYSVTYGSIGAVVVLMMWFYLSGIAILVGGEVNSEIEKAARHGERPVPKEE